MSRPFNMRAEDLPPGAVEEFENRSRFSFFRLPPWVFRIPSERYRHRARLRSLKERMKLDKK